MQNNILITSLICGVVISFVGADAISNINTSNDVKIVHGINEIEKLDLSTLTFYLNDYTQITKHPYGMSISTYCSANTDWSVDY